MNADCEGVYWALGVCTAHAPRASIVVPIVGENDIANGVRDLLTSTSSNSKTMINARSTFKIGSRSGFVTDTPRYDARNDLVTTRYDLVTTLRGVTERS